MCANIEALDRNVNYQSPISIVSEEISTHKTFLDTLGRTCLKLSAVNVIDESRDKDIIVSLVFSSLFDAIKFADKAANLQVTYDYPFSAAFRKPITVFLGVATVFVTAWAIGRLDVSIGKPS